MNTQLVRLNQPITSASAGGIASRGWHLEIGIFIAVLALLNLPLFGGGFADSLAFLPTAVQAGEWWRCFTHPFVHVSWYHLGLDAAAFLLAYSELRECRWSERITLLLATATSSLLAALWFAPAIFTHGLCGLSGIAHGVTAYVGLRLMGSAHDWVMRAAGLACFAAVFIKCLIEIVTGQILFASLHLGPLGTPIVVCHAGGLLGAVAIWSLCRLLRSRPPQTATLPERHDAKL